MDSNRLISDTKYPAFFTVSIRVRGRICISNHCVCCYDNTQPGSVVSSGMQSPKFESSCYMWFRRSLKEVSLFIHCHLPPTSHTRRWKCFLATLTQRKKNKECTKAYNKGSSPSREAERWLFLHAHLCNNVTKCQPGKHSETWFLYRNLLSVLHVNFPRSFTYTHISDKTYFHLHIRVSFHDLVFAVTCQQQKSISISLLICS